MNLPERSVRPWLLGVLPMAWASSALFVLGDGLLVAAVALAWAILGWKCLAGRRAIIARRVLALTLAGALPAQGFAAIAADVCGPAHFHAATESGAAHWHRGVMHHHHARGDAIVVDDGKRQQALATEETKRTAFGVDALPATPSSILPPSAANAPEQIRVADPPLHVALPPERPPRLFSASS